MTTTPAALRTEKVPVPAVVRDTPDARKADYRVAVRLDGGPELTAEQWARGCLEGAPAAMRRGLVLGWRLAFRLRLGPLGAPSTVLGWYVTQNTPDAVTLEVGSPLMLAQHHFVREDGGVVWVTLVRSHTRAGRLLWRAAAPGHESSMPKLLRRAAGAARP